MSHLSGGKKAQHLGRTVKTSPDDLRALVLDYLANNCYSETACALVKDSEVRTLDPDGDEILPPSSSSQAASTCTPVLSGHDWKAVDIRRDIREHIMSGRVDEATALLNEHFPAVLNESSSYSIPSKRLRTPDIVKYVPHSSVEPSHLSLNLRVLAFIEGCRTIPLRHNATSTTTSTSSRASSPVSLHNASEDPRHEEPALRNEDELGDLVQRAQKLHASVQMLPSPKVRERFSEELKYICSLLAYPVPEHSPVRRFMDQSRRNAIADQVNNAILYWTGSPSTSRLELYTRYTAVVVAIMRDLRFPLPPSEQPFPSSFDLGDFMSDTN